MRETETPITRPQGATDLNVVATTEVSQVFEGVSVTLFVTASGGTPPYSFRWDQNGGPEELTLVDVTEASLSVPPLTAPGRYVFRVVGVDVRGFSKMDFVAVVVLPAFNATVPALPGVVERLQFAAAVGAGAGE